LRREVVSGTPCELVTLHALALKDALTLKGVTELC